MKIYNISYMISISSYASHIFYDFFRVKVHPVSGDDLFSVLTCSPLWLKMRDEEAINVPGLASNLNKQILLKVSA